MGKQRGRGDNPGQPVRSSFALAATVFLHVWEDRNHINA